MADRGFSAVTMGRWILHVSVRGRRRQRGLAPGLYLAVDGLLYVAAPPAETKKRREF
jgi:hypothetical protein